MTRPLSAALLLALAAPLSAAPPTAVDVRAARARVLSHVPADYQFGLALCGVDAALGEQTEPDKWAALVAESEKTLRQTPEWPKFEAAREFLKREFDADTGDLRAELFGTCFTIVFRDRKGGGTEAVALAYVRDPARVRGWLDRIDRLRGGTAREVRVGKRAYRWDAADGGLGHFLDGNVVGLSSSRELLEAALSRDEPAAEGLLDRLGAADDLLTWWFRRAAFDAGLERAVAAAQSPADRAGTEGFARYLRAAESFGLSISAGPEPELVLRVAGDRAALPPGGRALLDLLADARHAWPDGDDALAALSGRVHWPTVQAALAEFQTPEDAARMREDIARTLGALFGPDEVPRVLGALGPRWRLSAADAPAEQAYPALTFALELSGPDAAAAGDQLLRALDFGAMALSFSQSRAKGSEVSFRTSPRGGLRVRTLSGPALPRGWTPSYAVKDGFLVLATAPEAVARFAPPGPAAAPAGDTVWFRVAGNPVLRFLRERKSYGIAELEQNLKEASFEEGERLELAVTVEPGRAALRLRARR